MPQPQCMNSNVGYYSNDKNFPVYLDEKAIQKGLLFLDETGEHAEPTLFTSPSSPSGSQYRYSKNLSKSIPQELSLHTASHLMSLLQPRLWPPLRLGMFLTLLHLVQIRICISQYIYTRLWTSPWLLPLGITKKKHSPTLSLFLTSKHMYQQMQP